MLYLQQNVFRWKCKKKKKIQLQHLYTETHLLQGIILSCSLFPHNYTHAMGQIQQHNAGKSVSVWVCLEQWHSMSDSHSLTLCLSVCLSALTLSVIADCAPASLSARLFAVSDSLSRLFDSWCVILSVCLSDVIQVQCARAESPGVTISFFFFFFLPPLSSVTNTFQSRLSGDACTCAC